MSTAAEVAGQFLRLADALTLAVDAGIDEGLAVVQEHCEAVNPVRTGRMKRGYFRDGGNGHWDLGNEMDYAEWVFHGTRHMRANAALNQVLDQAEEVLTEHVELAISGVLHSMP